MAEITSDRVKKAHTTHTDDLLINYLRLGRESLNTLLAHKDDARYAANEYNESLFNELVDKYSLISKKSQEPKHLIRQVARELFIGVPRWKSPLLLYNIGSAANSAAAAMYTLGMEENILNVNDGLAGNALVAERAVTNIMSDMAGIRSKSHGIFTFGGTATNLYGMKLGLKKACPDSSKYGLPNNVKVFVTEDSHFSHIAAADWLGIGTDNLVVIGANLDKSTDINDLEGKLRDTLEAGGIIGGLIINGGTTYDHTIDPIDKIIDIRDKLVEEFKLDYKPHVHVDSVIGWSWLMYKDYDWVQNPLQISGDVLQKLKRQYNKIKEIWRADSWGIDFHKGVGGCPATCSMIIINKYEDAVLLSRKHSSSADTHQLASEYSFLSPVDYTLETTRSGGAPLAALVALQSQGVVGYQQNLANLVQQTTLFKSIFDQQDRFQVTNLQSDGFVVAMRLVPPRLTAPTFQQELQEEIPQAKELSDEITKYTQEFFKWDYKTRMKSGQGPEYSYSSKYAITPSGTKLGFIKLYSVSPLINEHYTQKIANTIIAQRNIFDNAVWMKQSL